MTEKTTQINNFSATEILDKYRNQPQLAIKHIAVYLYTSPKNKRVLIRAKILEELGSEGESVLMQVDESISDLVFSGENVITDEYYRVIGTNDEVINKVYQYVIDSDDWIIQMAGRFSTASDAHKQLLLGLVREKYNNADAADIWQRIKELASQMDEFDSES